MNGIVQFSFTLGGVGNQLHKYCAARAWAHFVGARFEAPDWWGRRVFEGPAADPLSSCELPPRQCGDNGSPQLQDGETNFALVGYCQTQFFVSMMARAELKQHLRIRREWLELIGPPPADWYAAAHVREGDYVGHHCYANITEESYLRACDEFGIFRERLVWCRETQARKVVGLPPAWDGLGRDGWLPDFVTLMRARYLLRANSSFSWWAAVLGDAERVFAPVVEANVGRFDAPFVPGNHPRIAHPDRCGIQVDDLHMPGM